MASKEVQVRYVPTFEQTAYCLTKAVPTSRLMYLQDKLSVFNIPRGEYGSGRVEFGKNSNPNQSKLDGSGLGLFKIGPEPTQPAF